MPEHNDDLSTQETLFWSEEFNSSNILDYANAALSINSYLRVLFLEGFNSIVIPSRGAYPFFKAAQAAWYNEQQALKTAEDRYQERLNILMSPMHSVTILPFSADPTEKEQETKAIRKFWANVLSALINRQSSNPFLLYYYYLKTQMQHSNFESNLPRDLPTENFIFIDTVVSGRAICEIIDAFDELHLTQCHFVLIVDRNGQRLKEPYRQRLADLERHNRCTMVYVSNLWTEDRGPSVSGIWSTVYPQLQSHLKDRYDWSSSAYGAGSFYHKVSSSQVGIQQGFGDCQYNMPVTVLYAGLSTAIFMATSTIIHNTSLERDSSSLLIDFPDSRERIEKALNNSNNQLQHGLAYHIEHIKQSITEFGNYTPLRQSTTARLAEPRVKELHKEADIEVSRSHLVRIYLPEKKIDTLMQDFEITLKDKPDILSSAWFRPSPSN